MSAALPLESGWPIEQGWLDGLLSFALTYGVQATILLGLCALFARPLARGSARIEEGLWKTAVLGSLLTTILILSSGMQPLGGRLSLASLFEATPDIEARAPAVPDLALIHEASPRGEALPLRLSLLPAGAASPAAPAAVNWSLWIAGLLIGGALLGLFRLAFEQLAFRRRLAHRRALRMDEVGRPGALARLHEELLHESGLTGRVVLSASARLLSPIAFGLSSHEVCIPVRAIGDLEPEEQRAMLAHEIAHAARRDPAWNAVLRVFRAVFWFQPLLILAERRLHALFELRSDRRAAQWVEDPLALASCLTEVAAWIVPPVPKSAGAAAMATGRASLGARVDELLALSRDDLKTPDAPAWRSATYCVGTLVLSGIALTAPAVDLAEPALPTTSDSAFTAEAGIFRIEIADTLAAPKSAAEASPRSIDPLLIEVDVELAALQEEFAQLNSLARATSTPAIEARVRDLGHRLQSLLRSREKLERVLLSLPTPVHGSQAAPAPTNSGASAARD